MGSREIGPDLPPFVIADMGINHEGDVSKALQLVDAAADAGTDCCKIQTHITEMQMVPTDMKPGESSDERQWSSAQARGSAPRSAAAASATISHVVRPPASGDVT